MTTPLFDSIFLDFEFVHDLSRLAERALLETRANGIAIALQDGSEYVCRATAGTMAPSVGVRLQNDSGITAACILSGRAAVCADVTNDERVNAAACKELGIASIVVVPIKNADTVIGIIEALSEHSGAFGAAEQAVLERIAHEIEVWAPGRCASVQDDATRTPDVAALMRLIGVAENTRAEANEPAGDDLSNKPTGSEGPRVRVNFPLVFAPLVIFALIAALLIFGRSKTNQASVPDQISAQLTALPLSRTEFIDFSPAPPKPNRDNPASLPRTPAQAAALNFRKLQDSARAGDASAQVRLARALASGAGVPADAVAAEAWYIVAHLAGDANATNEMQSLSRRLSNAQIAAVRERLATMYWKGIGVKQDPTAAYVWLTLAQAAGAQDIGARKQRLAREMVPSQITEAKLRAKEWLKQHHQLMAQNTSN